MIPYMVEIEYLKGDGQAYLLLTPLTMASLRYNVTNFELEFSCPVNNKTFVFFGSGNQQMVIVNGRYRFDWALKSGNYVNISVNQRYVVQQKDGNLICNEQSYAIGNQTTALTTCAIFTKNPREANTQFTGNIYRLKTTSRSTGKVTHDFIPVRINNVGYFYDKIENKLYGNVGTGAFILGPDVAPVTYANEVAFLESWGNQYIDTGIKPSTDTKIELKCLYCKSGAGLTSYGALIGADDRDTAYTLNHSAVANFTYGLEFSNNFANPQARLLTFNSTAAPHNMRVYDEGGSLVTTLTCMKGVFEVNQNLYLFATNRNGTPVYGSNRIMYCKIYDGNTLVRDYVPVEYNGIGYMYDKVSGLFFDNKGTGKFLFGSIAKACARSYTRRQLMAKAPEEDWSKHYLTFKIVSAGTVTIKASVAAIARTIQYSIDGGTSWSSITTSTTAQSLGSFDIGDVILLKGTSVPSTSESNYNQFGGTARIDARGNIMSLIYGDNFINQKSLSGKTAAFARIFYGCTALRNAKYLSLPATTLSTNCYKQMFRGCSNLVTAPELPSKSVGQYSYHSMFQDCTNLLAAPEMPATTLNTYCYWQMFRGCTKLITPPKILPATSMLDSCYREMFYGCTKLMSIPSILATNTAGNCYRQMFQNCTSLTNVSNFPAVSSAATYCYCSMFEGCTNIGTAPSVLPATTLGTYCYAYMFKGTKIKTAPILPAITLNTGCYGQMFYNCKSLNYIKAMFTTTPSSTYTDLWVLGVSSSGTFVKNSAATWDVRGTGGIPNNWTVQTASE